MLSKSLWSRGGMEEKSFFFWLGRVVQFAYASVAFDRIFPSRAAWEPSIISGPGSTRIGGEQGGHQRGCKLRPFFFLSPAAEKMPAGLRSNERKKKTCCFSFAAFQPSHWSTISKSIRWHPNRHRGRPFSGERIQKARAKGARSTKDPTKEFERSRPSSSSCPSSSVFQANAFS